MRPDTLARRGLKARARDTIRRLMVPCLMASAAVVAMNLVVFFLQSAAGGLIFPGLFDPAAFPVQTGIWGVDSARMTDLGLGDYAALGGILAALRVESAGVSMVYVLPWTQIKPFCITMALAFLVSTPLRYGALAHLWSVAGDKPNPPVGLLRWYLDLRLTGKALATELVVELWAWLAQLICMVPALALMVLASQENGNSPLWYLVMALTVGGALAGYGLGLLFLPVRLMLTREPEITLPKAFAQGLAAFRGRRRQFFRLWLSFLPWQIMSTITYHLADLILFPYQNLSGIYFFKDITPPLAADPAPPKVPM